MNMETSGSIAQNQMEGIFAAGAEKAKELFAEQAESKADAATELATFPLPSRQLTNKQKDLKESRPVMRSQKSEAAQKKAEASKETTRDQARKFQEGHPEHSERSLSDLRDSLDPDDGYDDILAKVKSFYGNRTASEMDDALEFLLISTQGENLEKLHVLIQNVKDDFTKENGTEISKRREVTKLAREAADKGHGSAQNLNTLFNNMVAEQADATTLAKQLRKEYKYNQIVELFRFIDTSIGNDLTKANIEHSYLGALCNQSRTIGAVLNIYKGFHQSMSLVQSEYERYERKALAST